MNCSHRGKRNSFVTFRDEPTVPVIGGVITWTLIESTANKVDKDQVLGLITYAFSKWQSALWPIRFEFRENDLSASIKVFFCAIEHQEDTDCSLFFLDGEIAHAMPNEQGLTAMHIHINETMEWDYGYDVAAEGTFSFWRMIAHEIGHTLGLNHTDLFAAFLGIGRKDAIMSEQYDDDFLDVGSDDIKGVRYLYREELKLLGVEVEDHKHYKSKNKLILIGVFVALVVATILITIL